MSGDISLGPGISTGNTSSGDGTVETIQEGTAIIVNSTDPANPVVNFDQNAELVLTNIDTLTTNNILLKNSSNNTVTLEYQEGSNNYTITLPSVITITDDSIFTLNSGGEISYQLIGSLLSTFQPVGGSVPVGISQNSDGDHFGSFELTTTDVTSTDQTLRLRVDGQADTSFIELFTEGSGSEIMFAKFAGDTKSLVIGNGIDETVVEGVLQLENLDNSNNAIVLKSAAGDLYKLYFDTSRLIIEGEDQLFLNSQLNSVVIRIGSTDNTQQFQVEKSNGGTILLVEGDGAIRFNDYGTGTFSGTPEKLTAFNSGGSVLEIDATDIPEISQSLSTGVLTGGELTIEDAILLTYSISDGEGYIVDDTTNPPLVNSVSWSGLSNQTLTPVGSINHVFLDTNSSIVISATDVTPTQRRTLLYLGDIGIANGQLQGISSRIVIPTNPVSHIYDFMDAIGILNLNGNTISAAATDLSISKSMGTVFESGINYFIDQTDPHTKMLSAQSPATFPYLTQTGLAAPVFETLLDPLNYDVAGTVTTISGSNNQATIQYIYITPPTETLFIQYGQTIYSTLSDALVAATSNTDPFVIEPNIVVEALLLAKIVITKGCTDTSDTNECVFVNIEKFGGGNTGGVSTTSNLQEVYDNSTDSNKIELSASIGTFSIADNASPIGTDLFDIRDSSASISYLSVSATEIETSNDMIVSGDIGVGAAPAVGVDIQKSWGAQFRTGMTAQAGRIDFARGLDGGYIAYAGFLESATESNDFGFWNGAGSGNYQFKLNDGSGDVNTILRINNNGVSIRNDGTDATTISPSASLELQGTSGALLISRMTTAERNALTSENGMVIYNTDSNEFNVYKNGSWTVLSSSSVSPTVLLTSTTISVGEAVISGVGTSITVTMPAGAVAGDSVWIGCGSVANVIVSPNVGQSVSTTVISDGNFEKFYAVENSAGIIIWS